MVFVLTQLSELPDFSGVRLALLHFFCRFFDKNTIKQACPRLKGIKAES